jgi:hypothetical protein
MQNKKKMIKMSTVKLKMNGNDEAKTDINKFIKDLINPFILQIEQIPVIKLTIALPNTVFRYGCGLAILQNQSILEYFEDIIIKEIKRNQDEISSIV